MDVLPWGLLRNDRCGAPGFPDQLRGLRLQVANKLVQDRLGDGHWGSEDRGPFSQHAYGSDAAEEIRHVPHRVLVSIGSRTTAVHGSGSTDGGKSSYMIRIRRGPPVENLD